MTNNVQAVALTTNLDHQLRQATELRNLAYEVVLVEGVRDLKTEQHLALTIFYRNLQTHEAVEVLLRQKLVEDAWVLVRVLVEHVVNCVYMLVVGDHDTAKDFISYPHYWNHFIMQDLKAVDETRFRKYVSVELEEQTRKEYESLHPRFKDRRHGEWCIDSKLHQRAAKVDEKFSEIVQQPYNEFRWLVNSEWRFAGSHVHGNADTILDQITRSGKELTIEQKFDPEEAAEALYSANFGLGLALRPVDILLGNKHPVRIIERLRQFTGKLPPVSPLAREGC